MKEIKDQLDLQLEESSKGKLKQSPSHIARDTGNKPVPARKLAQSILKQLRAKKSRKAAAMAFLVYQLVEMTISLANTL